MIAPCECGHRVGEHSVINSVCTVGDCSCRGYHDSRLRTARPVPSAETQPAPLCGTVYGLNPDKICALPRWHWGPCSTTAHGYTDRPLTDGAPDVLTAEERADVEQYRNYHPGVLPKSLVALIDRLEAEVRDLRFQCAQKDKLRSIIEQSESTRMTERDAAEAEVRRLTTELAAVRRLVDPADLP